jgi:hypothetical protein
VQFVQKIAGHASERYIWRYVTPSENDVDRAAESLWEYATFVMLAAAPWVHLHNSEQPYVPTRGRHHQLTIVAM